MFLKHEQVVQLIGKFTYNMTDPRMKTLQRKPALQECFGWQSTL